MRKTIVITMTTFGMTLLILLGYIKPVPDQLRTRGDAAADYEAGTSNPARLPRVKLQAVVSLDDAGFRQLQRVTEQYEGQNRNVDIQLQNVNMEEMIATYRTQAAIGEGPDAMLVPVGWVRPDAAQGRLLALDEFVSAEHQSQWFHSVLGAVRWNSYIWGIPVVWDPYVFIQRSDAASDNAGSVDDRVKASEGDPGTMVRSDELGFEIMADLLGLTEVSLAKSGGSEAESPVQREAQTAITRLLELRDRGAAQARDAVVSVQMGESGWAFVKLSDAIRFGKPTEEQGMFLSIAAPIPADEHPSRRMPPFGGSAFVLSSATTQAKEAVDWILYVTGASIHQEWSSPEGEGWPVRRSVYRHLTTLGSGVTIDVQPSAEEEQRESTPLPGLLERNESRGNTGEVMRFLDGIPSQYGVPYWPQPAAEPPVSAH